MISMFMILLDGPQGLSCRRMLNRTLKVPNEYGT
jgi:hypothetical protein